MSCNLCVLLPHLPQMSRKTRGNFFLVQKVLELLDFDDSDEEALFEIDKDEVVLIETLAESDDPATVEIIDHQVPA